MGAQHDLYGNPVSSDTAALPYLNDFVEGFAACEMRVLRLLEIAGQDDSPLVQIWSAALHLFAEDARAASNARPFLQRACARQAHANARERLWLGAIEAWADGNTPMAAERLEALVQHHPRDLAALKLAHYHAFNLGDSPAMLRMALTAQPHCADVPYFHGMLAFAYEQCHLLRQAEGAARHAVHMRFKEPWAHHALAHVLLTEGRVNEGLDFMQSASGSWSGLNSFMQTHNWWHLALFLMEDERHDEALQLHDSQVWGVVPAYSQDQIGSISLLARLELEGVDVGQRWQLLTPYLLQRQHDHVLPFLDLQYLYGLARAEQWEAAQQLLASMQRHADAQKHPQLRAIWQEVCLPAARGVLAHAQGRYQQAARQLGPLIARLVEIGGSHAQRDLFTQLYWSALRHTGQWTALQNLVQPWRNQQPQSKRLARHMQRIYQGLGLPPALANSEN
ncbi:tetratricopeptide repeat protein [Comamonas odontotermitis]|uniref:tetratricopeptide repeat protein n=1 Tax=Comamonas odontotermitis TaxID=379895 RepID=UPI0037536685